DFQLRSVELLRPVTLLAGLGSGTQVVNGRGDGARIRLERGRKDLARTGEFGFHIPRGASADVAVYTGNAGVRRQLISRVLRRHDRVAKLSTELNRIGELIRLVAADNAKSDEGDEEGKHEGKGTPLAGIVEIDAQVADLAFGLQSAFAAVIPRPEGHQRQSGDQEGGRDHVSQDPDVWARVIGSKIDEKQEEEVAEGDHRKR